MQINTFCPLNTVPCQWRYEEFGACTKTCGGGTRTRFPVITTPEQHGGDCPQHVTNRVPDTETCNTQPCPSENEHSVKRLCKRNIVDHKSSWFCTRERHERRSFTRSEFRFKKSTCKIFYKTLKHLTYYLPLL